jgi:NitT/TauT family transport system substrate-binding protein
MQIAVRGLGRIMVGLFAGACLLAHAEVNEVRIARQYGIIYLPLMVVEDAKLIEKHAKAMGLGEVKSTWASLGGPTAVNDALLSGSVDFASGGVTSVVLLWARTQGGLNVKGVAAINSQPLFLNTRNPNIKSLRDFTEKDKIALPSVKVSFQAVTLQMAAAQAFGDANYAKLDSLTVSMSHPDGMIAMLTGSGQVNSHFTSAPFQYQELENPAIHTVLSSFDVLGGPGTNSLVWGTSKFRDANPRVYEAFVKALEEAMTIINADKRAAAEFYLRVSKDKGLSLDKVYKMLIDPQMKFSVVPENTMKYAEFMHRVGTIKVRPASWKEMYFPNLHPLRGS